MNTSTASTPADTLTRAAAELAARHARELAKLETAARVVTELPPGLPLPTIANERDDGDPIHPAAWLSFRSMPYGTDADAYALNVLSALESHGWRPAPACLAKFGQWRTAPRPCTVEALPDATRNGELRESETIAPLFLEWSQHTGAEAVAYYLAPSGRVYRVAVAPRLAGFRVSAKPATASGAPWRSREPHGGAYYVRESVRMLHPAEWHGLPSGLAGLAHSRVSRAHYSAGIGISASAYFTPHTDGPISPAALLAELIAAK